MANGKTITNDRLYDAINSTRLELKGDISDLRRQFDALEAGRLTRLEGKMSDFEVAQVKKDSYIKQNQAILSTKFIVIQTIGYVLLFAIMQSLSSRWIK